MHGLRVWKVCTLLRDSASADACVLLAWDILGCNCNIEGSAEEKVSAQEPHELRVSC